MKRQRKMTDLFTAKSCKIETDTQTCAESVPINSEAAVSDQLSGQHSVSIPGQPNQSEINTGVADECICRLHSRSTDSKSENMPSRIEHTDKGPSLITDERLVGHQAPMDIASCLRTQSSRPVNSRVLSTFSLAYK